MKRNHGLDLNPVTDFVICCGQTEAFAASIFAGVEVCSCSGEISQIDQIPTRRVVNVSQRIVTVIDQGDEVLLFDPAYETYEACIALAGGVPVSSDYRLKKKELCYSHVGNHGSELLLFQLSYMQS